MRFFKPLFLIVFFYCCSLNAFTQQHSDTLLKKSADSLLLQAKAKASAVVHNIGAKIPQLPSDTVSDTVIAQKLQAFKNEQVQSVKKQFNEISGKLSSAVPLFDKGKLIKVTRPQLGVTYSYLEDTSTMNLGIHQGPLQNNASYNFKWSASVANLPFSIDFSGNNSNYNIAHTRAGNLQKLNFDHKKYIEDIKQKAVEKVNPEKLMTATIDRINNIKAGYQQELLKEINQITTGFGKNYQQQFNLPADISNLDVTDISSLRSKIISTEAVAKYKASSERLQEILKTTDVKTLQNNPEYNLLKENIKEYESLEKIYSKVIFWKDRFNNNKIVKDLRSHLPFSPANFKGYLEDPKNLGSVLKGHANLSSLQSFFTKITKLDIGQNAVQGGQFDIGSLINTGLNADFKSDKFSLGAIVGKNNNVNNWLQGGLVNTATNEYSSLTGIRFGSGYKSPLNNSISLNVFEFANTPGYQDINNVMPPAYLPVASHKDAVLALQTTYPIASNHQVTIDVSKSIGLYSSNILTDSTSTKNNPLLSSLFGNEGKSNYAAMLTYDGEIKGTVLSATFKKVGLGYNNPGNPFLRRGESQFGLSFERRFLKNKLQVKYAADYRSQHFDPAKNYTYTAFSNKANISYRVNRDTRFKLSYQLASSNMELYNSDMTNGNNSRIQLDGGYRFRLKGIKITNNAAVSMSRMTLPLLDGNIYQNKVYTVMNTASVLLKKNIMSLSLFASSSHNREYYFNTAMINAEANYSYALKDFVRLSTGLGYYANAGWNKQVGLRQQLSTTVFEKLAIDAEIGYKQAIKTYRKELANQLYLNAGMRYNF